MDFSTPTLTYRTPEGTALPLLAPGTSPRYATETLQLEVEALRRINAAQREELARLRAQLAQRTRSARGPGGE